MRTIGNAGSSARKVEAIASGALSTGDTVVVNSDGTVSVVSETSVSETLGSPTAIDSGTKYNVVASYDSINDKIVVFYRDAATGYGTAVVGTVSGTSISWGTPVVFNSETTECRAATFDSGQGSHLIVYNAPSNYGASNVIQVSGTSISSGTKVVFRSGISSMMSCAYDSGNGKVIVSYRDSTSAKGHCNIGTISGTSITWGGNNIFYNSTAQATATTYDAESGNVVIFYKDSTNNGWGIVGTISGTSISTFGSPVQFTSNNLFYWSAAYDSAKNKHMLIFQDGGVSNYGRAVVASVSGTSISFGTVTTYSGSNAAYQMSVTYDEAAQKMTVSYRDYTNTNYGTYVLGTISGTSVTFSSPTVWKTEWVYPSAIYDSSSKVVVMAYENVGTRSANGAIVLQNAYTSTNLTANNYIGIADSDAADTGKAVVNTRGAVDDNQTGLTAGQAYYVQTDGTLSTTAGDPSVFAGTAVSATKLIVKG